MITNISVDGFKSLQNFELSFTPGLNILVGPNGSGKTNIVSFFEFVTHLMQVDASEATSRVGGAGAVFRRVGDGYDKNIVSKVTGCVAAPEPHLIPKKRSTRFKYIQYDYSFTLLFPETRDTVVFQRQRLQLRGVKNFICQTATDTPFEQWGIDIEMNLSPEGATSIKIHSFDLSKVGIVFYSFGSTKAKNEFENMLANVASPNASIINILARFSPGLWSMINDISTGQIYNIIPSRIKIPEDSAKSPGIARDGSGLAATLYAIQKNKSVDHFNTWNYFGAVAPNFRHISMASLQSYLTLVNSSIESIHVENDTFDNQLKVRFEVRSGAYSAIVPMSLMSDGTLKWVALVTAALTATSLFSCLQLVNESVIKSAKPIFFKFFILTNVKLKVSK